MTVTGYSRKKLGVTVTWLLQEEVRGDSDTDRLLQGEVGGNRVLQEDIRGDSDMVTPGRQE